MVYIFLTAGEYFWQLSGFCVDFGGMRLKAEVLRGEKCQAFTFFLLGRAIVVSALQALP